MPVTTPEQFSRKQTEDLETAMAIALTTIVDQEFVGPGGTGKIRFAQVFEQWATFEQNFVSPGAVVLPDEEILYGQSQTTPTLLEDTWETPGETGLGLYRMSEATRDFRVVIRASTPAARNALKAGIENSFVTPNVILASDRGIGNAVKKLMTEYWNLPVVFVLKSSRKLDDADSAAKNIWEAEFVIAGQAPHVKLGVVTPFRCRVRQVVT